MGDLLQNVRFRVTLLEAGCGRCSKNHPRCFVRRENCHGRRLDFVKNEYKCAFCGKNMFPLLTRKNHFWFDIALNSKASFPLRKISIGSDRIGPFSILYYPHRRTKKVESTLTLYHRIIGSNWKPAFKPLFHSSQNPTRKLAARTFIQSQYLKALAASLRVGFCDEWKRGLTIISL